METFAIVAQIIIYKQYSEQIMSRFAFHGKRSILLTQTKTNACDVLLL